MFSARLTPAVMALEVAVAPETVSTELLPEVRIVPDRPTYRSSTSGVKAAVPTRSVSLWLVTATPVTAPFRSTPTVIVTGPPKPWLCTATQ